MKLYLDMSQDNGKPIKDTDHLRQSVRDILLTPQGSRTRTDRDCSAVVCQAPSHFWIAGIASYQVAKSIKPLHTEQLAGYLIMR